MSEIAIVIAKTSGGIDAVIERIRGCQIIEGTKREFTALKTFTDEYFGDLEYIGTRKTGWIALAEKQSER